MHPACKDFNENLKNGINPMLLKCDIQLLEKECLHQHVKSYVMMKEFDQTQSLINEITSMFPQYPSGKLINVVCNIPVHINARYVLLLAVLNKWKGYQCPPFSLKCLQGENRYNQFDEMDMVSNQGSVDLTLNQAGPSHCNNDQLLSNSPELNLILNELNTIEPNDQNAIDAVDSSNLSGLDNNEEISENESEVGPVEEYQNKLIQNSDTEVESEQDDCDKNCLKKNGVNNFEKHDGNNDDLYEYMNEEEMHELFEYDKKIFNSLPDVHTGKLQEPGTSGSNNSERVRDWLGYEPQPSTSNTNYSTQTDLNCTFIDISNDHIPEVDNEIEIVDRPPMVLKLPAQKKKRKSDSHSYPIKMPKWESTTTNFPIHPIPTRDEAPIVIPDDVTLVSTRKLVNVLSEIFPDCDLNYLATICHNKGFHAGIVDEYTEKLLCEDYPKKIEETDVIDYDVQLDIMISVLPDADPEYLSSELSKMNNNAELKFFISNALETRSYPKAADAARIRQMHAQTRQYTDDFNPADFLNTIPEPEVYFTDKNFRAGNIDSCSPTYHHMLMFLRNFFNKISVKHINHVLNTSRTLLDAVKSLHSSKEGILVSKRRRVPTTACHLNIPLLQLFAYIENKDAIHQVKQDMIKLAAERKLQAIANHEVNTCCCCYDDEVMPEDTFACANGCSACKECIKRSVEILFSENILNYPCLADCGAHFSLDILQSCLSPKIFCKIAKRKQLDEVKAAGIEDLEICPFCDFAAIPAPDDKIFKCFNPECMKESCRECKEPSHIPLRCDELEKDMDVKQRTYVENQMTEALMRKCRECGLKYIKADGCNRIKCQCGATMCYICNAANVDYNHFNGQGANAPNRCPLYSNTELLHEKDAIKGGEQAKIALGITSLKVDPLADAEVRIKKALKEYKPMPGAHN